MHELPSRIAGWAPPGFNQLFWTSNLPDSCARWTAFAVCANCSCNERSARRTGHASSGLNASPTWARALRAQRCDFLSESSGAGGDDCHSSRGVIGAKIIFDDRTPGLRKTFPDRCIQICLIRDTFEDQALVAFSRSHNDAVSRKISPSCERADIVFGPDRCSESNHVRRSRAL